MPPDDSVLLHTVDLEPPEELQIVPVTNDMEDIRDPEEEVSPDESLQETTDTDTETETPESLPETAATPSEDEVLAAATESEPDLSPETETVIEAHAAPRQSAAVQLEQAAHNNPVCISTQAGTFYIGFCDQYKYSAGEYVYPDSFVDYSGIVQIGVINQLTMEEDYYGDLAYVIADIGLDISAYSGTEPIITAEGNGVVQWVAEHPFSGNLYASVVVDGQTYRITVPVYWRIDELDNSNDPTGGDSPGEGDTPGAGGDPAEPENPTTVEYYKIVTVQDEYSRYDYLIGVCYQDSIISNTLPFVSSFTEQSNDLKVIVLVKEDIGYHELDDIELAYLNFTINSVWFEITTGIIPNNPELNGQMISWKAEDAFTGKLRISFTMDSTTEVLDINASWQPEQEPAVVTLSAKTDCNGASIGNISISPEGVLHTGDDVTLTAPNVIGYTFLGWYKGNEVVSTALVYSFAVTEDTELVAKYAAYASASVSISAINKQAQYTVGDSSTVQSGGIENVPLGSTLTLTAVNAEDLLYWENESNKIIGKSAALSIAVTRDMVIRLVYKAEASGQSFVQFVSDYNQVLHSKNYSASDTIDFPVAPTKLGYSFLKWVFEGTDIEAADDAIKERIGPYPTITIKPKYEKDETACSVTVKYVGPQQQADVYNGIVGEGYTVTAPEFEGFIFNYWKADNGSILGYSSSYFFQITGDTTLTAVYSNEAASVKPVIAISDLFTVAAEAHHKIIAVATRSVPEGYTVLEHGMLYRAGSGGLDETTFVVGASGVKISTSSDYSRNGSYSMAINVSSDSTDVYFRGYMVVKNDATEEISTLYTQIVHRSYSSENG